MIFGHHLAIVKLDTPTKPESRKITNELKDHKTTSWLGLTVIIEHLRAYFHMRYLVGHIRCCFPLLARDAI